MEQDEERGRMKRKRRKLGHHQDAVETHVLQPRPPGYNFLNLASLILEHDIAILFPGTERPRNSHALIGAGGSFLVFRENRTMDQLTIRAEQIRSLEDSIVLKRTRQNQEGLYPHIDSSSGRYLSIMAELQILLDPFVQAHENIIDLQGLTWDFEPEDDGSHSVWPVIGLEEAVCSMHSLMNEYDETVAPLSTRIQYCYNVAEAIRFLHERGVAHCDVKLENALICVTQRSGSVGKLSDFGSAILGVNDDTFLPRGVAGTPPWNAPEYRKALRGPELFKVDVFSFGMLVWRFLAHWPTLQILDYGSHVEKEELMKKLEEMKLTDELAQLAIKEVKEKYDGSEELDSIVAVMGKALAPGPEDRCDMTYIASLLEQSLQLLEETGSEQESDLQAETEDVPQLEAHVLGSEIESEQAKQPILPIQTNPFYISFEDIYALFQNESPLVKEQLIKSLKACAGRENESMSAAGTAAYHLSMCYVNAFGTRKDSEEAWMWIMESAQLQNPIARSQAFRLHRALFPDRQLTPETKQQIVEWLKESVLRGSAEAAEDLRSLDSSVHEEAIRSWEKRYCKIDLGGLPEPKNLEYVSKLRQRLSDIDINVEDLNERGNTKIHIAASFGDISWLIELLELGSDIDSVNLKGETPLLCACRANEPQAALFLLKHGAGAFPAASGESPLHWLIAIDEPYLKEIAIGLIENGAELEQIYAEIENNDLTFDIYPLGTPLDWAVSKRRLPVIQVLTELGSDPFVESSQFSSFDRAVSAHDWRTVEILLTSNHASPSRVCATQSSGRSLLFEAIYCYSLYERLLHHGQDIKQAATNTIRLLLEAGCDSTCVDSDGISVMHALASFCDCDFIKMVLEEFDFGKFINARVGDLGQTPLLGALAGGTPGVFELLIEYGADTYVQYNERTLLHLLACMGEEDYSIRCLNALGLNSRTDLDALAPSEDFGDGLTAFEIAVYSSRLKIAKLLLEAGVNPAAEKSRDRHFISLLIDLPSWESLPALRYYLDEVEAPFRVRKSTSLSVLHLAAIMMQSLADSNTGEQKLNLLLDRFSSHEQVNAKTTGTLDPSIAVGQTPLHNAAKFGVYYAVRKFLQAGADPSLRDDEGKTPLDLARKQLGIFTELTMKHEKFRIVSDLKSVVALLEQPQTLSTITPAEEVTSETHLRTRFSWLGFQTQPADQE